jgi:hypothetical protein
VESNGSMVVSQAARFDMVSARDAVCDASCGTVGMRKRKLCSW